MVRGSICNLKKVKNRASWTYLSKGINGEDIIGTFNEKERQKAKQTAWRIEEVIKTNDNKMYVKWKSFDNSDKCKINKSDILWLYIIIWK